jgi:hypothetical protein
MKRDPLHRIIAALATMFAVGTLAAQPTPPDSLRLGPLVDDSVRLAPCDSVTIMREMIESLWSVGWNGGSKSGMRDYRAMLDSEWREMRRKARPPMTPLEAARHRERPWWRDLREEYYRSWRETKEEKLRPLLWTTSIAESEDGGEDVSSYVLVWAQFRDTLGRVRWALGGAVPTDDSLECHEWWVDQRPVSGNFSAFSRRWIKEGLGTPREFMLNFVGVGMLTRIDLRPDAPRTGIHLFDHPPTNADIYHVLGDISEHPGDPNVSITTWGLMNRQLGTWGVEGQKRTVAGTIWRENWKEAVGEYPTREFKYLKKDEEE